MNNYDVHLTDTINSIMLNIKKVELSLLGKELKNTLKKNKIFFYFKQKHISPNTYIKLRHNNLKNFILNNTKLSIDYISNAIIVKIN